MEWFGTRQREPVLTVAQWLQMGQAFRAARQYCADSSGHLDGRLLDAILGTLSALSMATQGMDSSDGTVALARVRAFASVRCARPFCALSGPPGFSTFPTNYGGVHSALACCSHRETIACGQGDVRDRDVQVTCLVCPEQGQWALGEGYGRRAKCGVTEMGP